MSPAPEPTRPLHRPAPVTGSEYHADVIEIRPGLASHAPASSGHSLDPRSEVVVLGRLERSYSTPPPPRVPHRGWVLSSIVIAGGGVLAVMIAGELGDVPLVATVALLATVVCGAILVAAQLTEEVRRARSRRQHRRVTSSDLLR